MALLDVGQAPELDRDLGVSRPLGLGPEERRLLRFGAKVLGEVGEKVARPGVAAQQPGEKTHGAGGSVSGGWVQVKLRR
jgi:hypothetical protein